MTARARIRTLLACAAVAIGLTGSGPAGATEVTSAHFFGPSVDAVFLQLDGCATHSAFLAAWEGRWTRDREGMSQPGTLYVNFQTNDPCGIGWEQHFAIVPLPPAALKVRGDLGTATLRGTFPFWDTHQGATVPLDVDLTWRATGPLVRDRIRSHAWSRLLGAFRLAGTTLEIRDADASGRLFDGTHEWATGATLLGADIASTRLGTVTIDH